MGAAASIETDFVTKDRARELAGDNFDELRFDAAAVDGQVSKDIWNQVIVEASTEQPKGELESAAAIETPAVAAETPAASETPLVESSGVEVPAVVEASAEAIASEPSTVIETPNAVEAPPADSV